MEAYEEQIAKLEEERSDITNRCAVLIANRDNIQDEYDRISARRLEAQKEINQILRDEIERERKAK